MNLARIKQLIALPLLLSLSTGGLPYHFSPPQPIKSKLFVHLAPNDFQGLAALKLNPTRRKQVRNLIETLDLVISFMESKSEHKATYMDSDWPNDTLPQFFGKKRVFSEDSAESLIPAFLFYNALGLSNIKFLRELLRESLKNNEAVPKKLPLQLEKPLGIYKFTELTRHLLSGEGILDQLKIKCFYRGYGTPKEVLLELTGYTEQEDASGLSAFKLIGDKADETAKIIFSFNRYDWFDAETIKKHLLNETALAVQLSAALGRFLESVTPNNRDGSDQLRVELLEAARKYERAKTSFLWTHNHIRDALAEKEGEELKKDLKRIKEKIEAFGFILGSKDGGETINYLNLAGITDIKLDPRKPGLLATGVTDAVLDLDQLLRQSASPAQLIIKAIVFRLGENRDDNDKPLVGSFEAALGHTLLSFPKETFKDDYTFYNLLKVLSTLKVASPEFKSLSKKVDYQQDLAQSILSALKKANPRFLTDSLKYLDKEDTYETEVRFLAAMGWIDASVEWSLLQDFHNTAFISRVKKLISAGIVATKEDAWKNGEGQNHIDTLAATETTLSVLKRNRHVKAWPQERALIQAWDRLFLYTFIKYKLFFTDEPVNETNSRLAFLSPEDFNKIALNTRTVQALTQELAIQFEKEKSFLLLRGLYASAFASQQQNIHAAAAFLEAVAGEVFKMGARTNLTLYMNDFKWLLHSMGSFLSVSSIKKFLNKLFFIYVYERTQKQVFDLFYKVIRIDAENEIKRGNTVFPVLSQKISELFIRFKTPQDLELSEELENLNTVAAPAAFLRDFGAALEFHDGAIPEHVQKKFVHDLVLNRLSSAHVHHEQIMKDALKEALDEGIPVMEIMRMSGELIEKYLAGFQKSFEKGNYLSEMGKELNIAAIITKARRAAKKPGYFEDEERSFGEAARIQTQTEFLSLMELLDREGVLTNNRLLRELINTPPQTRIPIKTSHLSARFSTVYDFFVRESNPALDESL